MYYVRLCPHCRNMNLQHCFDGKWSYDRCGLCSWESKKWRYVVSDNSGTGEEYGAIKSILEGGGE